MSTCVVCQASTDLFLCKHCGSEVERAIGDMPSLFHELSVVATRQTHVYRTSATAQRQQEPAFDPEAHLPSWLRSKDGRTALRPTVLPVDLDASEALWVAGNTLSTWTRHLAESRGAETPTAEAMIGWLLAHIDSIRADESAGEIHDEITSLHRDLEHRVDRSPSRLYAGPCHAKQYDEDAQPISGQCERDLYAWPSADTIVCDGYRADGVGCRAQHTYGERYEWLRESVEDALVTPDELREAMPSLFPALNVPPRGVWLSWVRETEDKSPRLHAVGQNRVGEKTYRGGDLLDMVARYTPKTWAPRPNRGRMSA